MSTVRVACGHCGATLKAPPPTFGKVLKCPKCRQPIHIPNPEVPQAKPPIAEQIMPPPSTSPVPPQAAPQTSPPANETAAELADLRRELRMLREEREELRDEERGRERRRERRDEKVVVHVHESPPPRTDGLGIASFVLGCIAFILCLMPCAAIIGAPLAVLGAVLALIGLCVGGRGFSIAGLVLNGFVVVIAVLWVGVVGTALTALREGPGASKERTAQFEVQMISNAVKTYFIDHDRYPGDLTMLLQKSEIGRGPYLTKQEDIIDPWGRIYQYDPAGPRHDGLGPDVWTTTPAGRVIGNWNGP